MKRFVLLGVDLSLIAMATILAQLLRDNFELSAQHFGALLPYLFFSLICAAVILTVTGTSGAMWRFTTTTDYLKIALACALTVLASVGVAFSYSRLDGVARAVPILQLMLMSILMISARLLIRSRNRRRFKPAQLKSVSSTRPLTSVLVVGATTLTELYLRAITECAADRVQVVGVVARKDSKVGRTLLGHKVLGSSDAILPLINELNVHGIRVDRIAVMTAHAKLTAPEQQALAEVEGKTDIIVQYLDEIAFGGGSSAIQEEKQQASRWKKKPDAAFVLSNERLDELARRPYWRFKRMLDILFASLLIALMAPIAFVVALLVGVDVGFPLIFWQQRPGVGGYPFRIYKFRTMATVHAPEGWRAPDQERFSENRTISAAHAAR